MGACEEICWTFAVMSFGLDVFQQTVIRPERRVPAIAMGLTALTLALIMGRV